MKTLQIIMMILVVTSLNSQSIPNNYVYTQAGTVNAFTKVDPPAIFLYRNELNTTSTATFQIEAPDSPDSVKKAINYAAKI
ncbi:MAG: hypothetical protein QME58_14255 [Bacteroidota bacterium]|nr:hypothetical protein [Bacteroidota bacterium]